MSRRRNPVALAAFAGLALLAVVYVVINAPTDQDHRDRINAAIDAFHHAAETANIDAYFNLLSDDARFLGTDQSERWTKPEFRDYCLERGAFSEAPAWVYHPADRALTLGPRHETAWFDEDLTHDRYGTLRGSGVLVREHGEWKIAQYNLTFLVPNDRAAAVVAAISPPSPSGKGPEDEGQPSESDPV